MLFGLFFQLLYNPPKNGWGLSMAIFSIILTAVLLNIFIMKIFYLKNKLRETIKFIYNKKGCCKEFEKKIREDDDFADKFNKYFTKVVQNYSFIYSSNLGKSYILENINLISAMNSINLDTNRNYQVKMVPADNSCGFHAFLMTFYEIMKKEEKYEKLFFNEKLFIDQINRKIYRFWYKKALNIYNKHNRYEECTNIEIYTLIFYFRMVISSILLKYKNNLIFDVGKDSFYEIFSYTFNTDEWLDQTCLMGLSFYFHIKIAFINVNFATEVPYSDIISCCDDADHTVGLILKDNHWESLDIE